jgi:hypothetical protein
VDVAGTADEERQGCAVIEWMQQLDRFCQTYVRTRQMCASWGHVDRMRLGDLRAKLESMLQEVRSMDPDAPSHAEDL